MVASPVYEENESEQWDSFCYSFKTEICPEDCKNLSKKCKTGKKFKTAMDQKRGNYLKRDDSILVGQGLCLICFTVEIIVE